MKTLFFQLMVLSSLMGTLSVLPGEVYGKDASPEKETLLIARANEKKFPAYIEPLLKARSVTDQYLGRGGESPTYKIFQKALKDKTLSFDGLKQSIKDATPAGKIYIAMIIYHKNKTEGKAILKSLLKDDTELRVSTGCLAHLYTVGKAAQELFDKGTLLSVYPPQK